MASPTGATILLSYLLHSLELEDYFCGVRIVPLTLTTDFTQGAPCGFSYKTFQEGSIPGYKLDDLQLSQMKMYNLTYGHYKRIHEKLP